MENRLSENQLYLESGYLNMATIMRLSTPFIVITGGRGTGKTYSALEQVIESGKKFIFLRRTESQCQTISDNDFNVFNPLNRDRGWNIGVFRVNRQTMGYYRYTVDEDGKKVKEGDPLGFLCALSTLSNKRGFDASEIDIVIFDEFCPEPHERPLKREAEAFFNAYETINRNRELQGRKPLQALLLANSNDLSSAILVEMNLVPVIDKLRKSGKQIWSNQSITMIRLQSPISKQKAGTALYKMLGNRGDFVNMSINNDFTTDYTELIAARPLIEYRPVCSVNGITIYKHKSKDEYYVSAVRAGACREYTGSKQEIKAFRAAYGNIYKYYINRKVYFSEPVCEIKFLTALDKL